MYNGITAHRGDSGRYPENTIEAFQAALEVGADWIELDVWTTRDGQLAVIHDRDTARVAERNLVAEEADYAELAELDAAFRFRAANGLDLVSCPPARIPLLEEVLALVLTQDRTRVSIQPKSDCVDAVLALVTAMHAEDWIGFNDGSLEKMRRVKELSPTTPVFWDRGENVDVGRDVRTARDCGFEAMVLYRGAAAPEDLAVITAAGMEAGVWTVDDSDEMDRFLAAGARRLYTDFPGRMMRVILSRKYGRHVEFMAHRGLPTTPLRTP